MQCQLRPMNSSKCRVTSSLSTPNLGAALHRSKLTASRSSFSQRLSDAEYESHTMSSTFPTCSSGFASFDCAATLSNRQESDTPVQRRQPQNVTKVNRSSGIWMVFGDVNRNYDWTFIKSLPDFERFVPEQTTRFSQSMSCDAGMSMKSKKAEPNPHHFVDDLDLEVTSVSRPRSCYLDNNPLLRLRRRRPDTNLNAEVIVDTERAPASGWRDDTCDDDVGYMSASSDSDVSDEESMSLVQRFRRRKRRQLRRQWRRIFESKLSDVDDVMHRTFRVGLRASRDGGDVSSHSLAREVDAPPSSTRCASFDPDNLEAPCNKCARSLEFVTSLDESSCRDSRRAADDCRLLNTVHVHSLAANHNRSQQSTITTTSSDRKSTNRHSYCCAASLYNTSTVNAWNCSTERDLHADVERSRPVPVSLTEPNLSALQSQRVERREILRKLAQAGDDDDAEKMLKKSHIQVRLHDMTHIHVQYV